MIWGQGVVYTFILISVFTAHRSVNMDVSHDFCYSEFIETSLLLFKIPYILTYLLTIKVLISERHMLRLLFNFVDLPILNLCDKYIKVRDYYNFCILYILSI